MVPSGLLTAPAWLGELQTCDYFIASLTAFSPYSLGETCSHIAALLFKVEACVRLGYTNVACTSRPCTWNQAFSKKVSIDQLFYMTIVHVCVV